MNPRSRAIAEVLGVWLGTLLLIRAAVMAAAAGAPEAVLVLVPILFAWVPVWDCRRRGEPEEAYPLTLPPWAAWKEGAGWAGLVGLVVFPPWAGIYHLWQTRLFDAWPIPGRWPETVVGLAIYHLAVVALPEEIFYRAYLQARLEPWGVARWRVFGVDLGWPWVATAVLFAVGHSVVAFQPWHVGIILPGLVFGWFRARTGDIAAGAIFHAMCNVAVAVLDTHYGIVPP